MSGNFLEGICSDMEVTIEDSSNVKIPKDFFDINFLPYLTGEREHLNIYAKIAEITNDGYSGIELIGDNGEVVVTLPPIINGYIGSENSKFDNEVSSSININKLMPGSGDRVLKKALEDDVDVKLDGAWDSYINNSNTVVGQKDTNSDDDDDEIIY